jgi:hypothetical protein
MQKRTFWRLHLGAILMLAFVSQASAQVKYVDERGVTHYVGSAEQVPAQYRDQTEAARLAPVTGYGNAGSSPGSGMNLQQRLAVGERTACQALFAEYAKDDAAQWRNFGERGHARKEFVRLYPQCVPKYRPT